MKTEKPRRKSQASKCNQANESSNRIIGFPYEKPGVKTKTTRHVASKDNYKATHAKHTATMDQLKVDKQ